MTAMPTEDRDDSQGGGAGAPAGPGDGTQLGGVGTDRGPSLATGGLPCEPVQSVGEAVAQMEAIDAALPAGDGVAAFNRMYLAVTASVGDAVRQGFFADSEFLSRLDVVFANHYFNALACAQGGDRVPRSWEVLWQRRDHPGLAPLQFAFAGMNAHINHDLVLALVETLHEFGASPHEATMRADFDRVNDLLARLEAAIRRSFEAGVLLRLEQRWGGVEDRVDSWSIAAARAAAWQDAAVLWRVRDHLAVRARYEQLLDEAVSLAGRCLLSPLGHRPNHHPHECAGHRPALVGHAG